MKPLYDTPIKLNTREILSLASPSNHYAELDQCHAVQLCAIANLWARNLWNAHSPVLIRRDLRRRPILQHDRDQLLTFNDDIQVTAAVGLGAVLGAVKVTGKSLKEQQIAMLGAGSTGVGVADGLRAAMISEGLSEEEVRSRFCIVKPLNVNSF